MYEHEYGYAPRKLISITGDELDLAHELQFADPCVKRQVLVLRVSLFVCFLDFVFVY